jgi:flagellar hook-associated protein 2
MSLSDLAYAIRQSGAPVSATVFDDGVGNKYLSLSARDSGYPQTGLPGAALGVSFASSGSLGTVPAFTTTDARNAHLTVDGILFERTSNTITDVVPGASLTLSKVSDGVTPPATPGGDPSGGTAETLTMATDAAVTQSRLKGFVDAYNALMSAIQKQLNVSESADRGASLAGDSTVRGLQARLHTLVSTSATGLQNGIRSLADLGVKTGRDGTLSIDAAALSTALGKDASAVNAIFSTASTGMAAAVTAMNTTYTRSGDGLFTVRQSTLSGQIAQLTDSMTAQQRRVDLYRKTLVQQFTAMETIVSQWKSVGSYLG